MTPEELHTREDAEWRALLRRADTARFAAHAKADAAYAMSVGQAVASKMAAYANGDLAYAAVLLGQEPSA